MDQFLVALAAATLTFGFFLGGEVLTRAYERYRKHHNALVRLERMLVRQGSVTEGNIKRTEAILHDAEHGTVFGRFPRELPEIDDGTVSDLYDVRIVSDVLNLNHLVGSLNAQRSELQKMYGAIVWLRERDATRRIYDKEAKKVAHAFKDLSDGEVEYVDDAKRTLAKVLLLLKEPKSLAWRSVQWTTRKVMMSPRPAELTERKIEEELREIEVKSDLDHRGQLSDVPSHEA